MEKLDNLASNAALWLHNAADLKPYFQSFMAPNQVNIFNLFVPVYSNICCESGILKSLKVCFFLINGFENYAKNKKKCKNIIE